MDASNGVLGSRARVDLAPVATLLLSASLLVLGNGLQGTLLLVRAGNEGFQGEVIGGMMSAYFGAYRGKSARPLESDVLPAAADFAS